VSIQYNKNESKTERERRSHEEKMNGKEVLRKKKLSEKLIKIGEITVKFGKKGN